MADNVQHIADYVAVPEPLWLDLVEGFLPYLAADEKLANAWVAVGEWLDLTGRASRAEVANHERWFGRPEQGP